MSDESLFHSYFLLVFVIKNTIYVKKHNRELRIYVNLFKKKIKLNIYKQ